MLTRYTGGFRLYDIDDDGYITRDEMLAIVEAVYGMVGKSEDIDGRTPEKRVEMIFKLMDKVGLGRRSHSPLILSSRIKTTN